MKNNCYILFAFALLLVACADSDYLGGSTANETVEIGFRVDNVQHSTRANDMLPEQEVTNAWMQTYNTYGREYPTRVQLSDNVKFGVYGYKDQTTLFQNTAVGWDNYETFGGEEQATPQLRNAVRRFWDPSAVDCYNFYAYAPYLQAEGDNNPYLCSTLSEDVKVAFSAADKTFTFKGSAIGRNLWWTSGPTLYGLNADNRYEETHRAYKHFNRDTPDLCVADAVTNTDLAAVMAETDQRVHLNFKHIFSKLSFQIKKADNVSATITHCRMAAFFPKTEEWTWHQDGAQMEYTGYQAPETLELTANGTEKITYADQSTAHFRNLDHYNEQHFTGVTEFDLNDLTKQTAGTATDRMFGPDAEISTTAQTFTGNTCFLPPNNATALTAQHKVLVLVAYDIEYGDGTVQRRVVQTGEFSIAYQPNYAYTVTIILGPKAITFEAKSVDQESEQEYNVQL